ncbi:hypothetical protein GJ496_002379 [Pomphorhynchus laevis]|nr:hypothetical protein GJ496_002379 [Pomphorhynchus laevis]
MLLQNLSDSISGESINQKINSIVNVDDVSVKVTLGNQETPFNLEDPSHRGGMQYKQYRYTDTVHTPSPSITDSCDIHIKDLTSETSGFQSMIIKQWNCGELKGAKFLFREIDPQIIYFLQETKGHSDFRQKCQIAPEHEVFLPPISTKSDGVTTNLGRKFTGEHDTSGNYKRIRNTFDGVNQIVAIGRKQSKQIERD